MRHYKRNVESTKNLKKDYMELYLSYFDDDDDDDDDFYDGINYNAKDSIKIESYTRSNYFWPRMSILRGEMTGIYKNGKFYYKSNYVIDIIDMESFYSKEKIRSKRISEILDDNKDLSNTIENIINK